MFIFRNLEEVPWRYAPVQQSFLKQIINIINLRYQNRGLIVFPCFHRIWATNILKFFLWVVCDIFSLSYSFSSFRSSFRPIVISEALLSAMYTRPIHVQGLGYIPIMHNDLNLLRLYFRYYRHSNCFGKVFIWNVLVYSACFRLLINSTWNFITNSMHSDAEITVFISDVYQPGRSNFIIIDTH